MDVVPVLCVLGLLCSLAMAVDGTLPPEDDVSGDFEDSMGSGSGDLMVDSESKGVKVYPTLVSTLVPTVEGSTAAQEPEIDEETKMEDTTQSAETTKIPNAVIEDLFADTVAKETATQEATTSPFHQTSTADLIEEIDTKKHHHHHHHNHHHHPHHHHTTTSSTFLAPDSDGHDNTTDVPSEVGKPHDLPEKIATISPSNESELNPQELTTSVEHLEEHGGVHEETTSGSNSSYVDEVAVESGSDLSSLDTLATSTVAEDSHTRKHHPHHPHNHHHHHSHQTTTSTLDGSDVQQETTMSSDLIEHENVQEEPTTTVAEDGDHHRHPHHTHHNKTIPSTPSSTETERPHEVHTHEPKGRKIIPNVRTTTDVPVGTDGVENNDFTSSTVLYNVSWNPLDEEPSDTEEGSTGGVTDDMYFVTPVVHQDKMAPPNQPTDEDDGNSNASHGIMERKELLAGIIAGGVAGLVFAAILVAFVLYRMKKKDEGSYSLEEPKQSNGGYQKPREQREFYA